MYYTQQYILRRGLYNTTSSSYMESNQINVGRLVCLIGLVTKSTYEEGHRLEEETKKSNKSHKEQILCCPWE